MATADAKYDYSQDNKVLELPEDDDDMEPQYDRKAINADNLEGDTKAAGIAVKSEAELKGNPLFAKKEVSGAVKWMAVKPWKGAIKEPSNAPRNDSSAPDKSLQLVWMHGYHGWDQRSNVVYNRAGRIVYPIAGTVVVYDAKTNRQELFMGHNDDITCLAQSPADANLVVTGQVATIVNRRATAPHICVWDTSDFKKCWTIKNAGQRAIKSVGFSGDGKLIASVGADDNQTVRVWDYTKESAGLVGEEKGDTNKIFQVRWNHKIANEFVTVGDKHIFFWTMDGGRLKKTKAQMGGKYPWQAFYSVAFSEKGYACCGGGDGSIYVFIEAMAKKVVKIHSGKIFSLDWYAGGLVSGGGDSTAVVLDKTLTPTKSIKFNNKVSAVYIQGENMLVGTAGAEIYEVKDFKNAENDESKLKPTVRGHFDGELWGLAINPDGKTFVTAGEDNTIYVYNVVTHELLAQTTINDKRGLQYKAKRASTSSAFPPNQCARAVCYSPDGKLFAIGTNSGEVHVFKSTTLERVATQDLNKYGKRNVTNQNQNWIQAMKFSPSGNTLAVGSHGFVVVLLDAKNGFAPGGVLDKHNASITQLDWSVDGKLLQCNDMAYELLFHNVDEKELKNSRQNTSATETKDTRWATQTCILGWSVQGIFDPQQDGTDVNTVDTSPSRTLVVTGDDYGNVNLFRYPVAKEGNAKKAYDGHSSHVAKVAFTPDERFVISAGGADKAVGIWRVV